MNTGYMLNRIVIIYSFNGKLILQDKFWYFNFKQRNEYNNSSSNNNNIFRGCSKEV